MGAEFDAEVTVDGAGNAMADGGVCCTLRDLARFGRLMLEGGRRDGQQVVPEAWIADILTPDPDSREAFLPSDDAHEFPPGAYYRNKWWVVDADKRLSTPAPASTARWCWSTASTTAWWPSSRPGPRRGRPIASSPRCTGAATCCAACRPDR